MHYGGSIVGFKEGFLFSFTSVSTSFTRIHRLSEHFFSKSMKGGKDTFFIERDAFWTYPNVFFCEKPCPIFLCTLWLLQTCWWNILNDLVENPPPKKKHIRDCFQFADFCARANVPFQGICYIIFEWYSPKWLWIDLVNHFFFSMFFAHVWFTERQRPGDHQYQSM